MKNLEPRFFDGENKIMAFLEWEAIRVSIFGGQQLQVIDAFPEYEQRHNFWRDPFYKQKTKEHTQLYLSIVNDKISIDEFYERANALLKPKSRGKHLKDKKRRTSQEAYQREKLGDAFIENKELIAAAHKLAYEAVETGLKPESITERITQLAFEHDFRNISDKQITTLYDFVQAQIDKHNVLDRIEAAIIDTDDKSLVFMWCKIKRKYPKASTFAWPTAQAAKEAKCSKSNVGLIMKRLEKLGAITLLQAGRSGRNSGRAAIYRREI